MTSKARVPQAEITGIFGAMARRYSKKRLGQVPEPLGVMWHNRPVLKAREVPRWRESSVFTPLERDVMEYAEAMTQTPAAVTDEMSERLLEELGAPALVELTAFIGAANMAGRTNATLGIEAQGFSEACGLQPLATPTAAVAASA